MTAITKPTADNIRPKGKGAATVEAARRADAFISAYARTGNATQASIEAGYSKRSANQQGSVLMAKPNICARAHAERQKFMAETEGDLKRQARKLVEAADDAIRALHEISHGGDAAGRGAVARVAASIAILDRAGHKPVEKIEQKTELTTDAAAAREKLKQRLGVDHLADDGRYSKN